MKRRLDFFLKEIDDKYVQENFWRLKLFLDTLDYPDTGSTVVVPPVTPPSGGGGSGTQSQLVDTFVSNAGVAAGNLVTVTAANTVNKISSNSSLAIPKGIFGICLSKPNPTSAEVVFVGRADFYSGLTVGGAVYISTAGAITQTPPTTGMLQQIGFATSATEIFVNILQPFRRS